MNSKLIRHLVLIFAMLLCINTANATIPKVKEITTSSGFKPWIIEDSYLPIVSIQLAFKESGFAYDPAGKSGLSSMVSGLLDEGAGDISSLDFRKRLEELAIEMSFSVDEENFYVSIKTLTENLQESLKLLNLALTKASFEQSTVDRIRNQILALLVKKEESPQYLAYKKFKETIFKNHPYSNPEYGTMDDVLTIQKSDLTAFAKRNFTRENILISVVGDIKSKEIPKLLDKYLKLPEKRAKVSELPEVSINDNGQAIHIEKSIPQSVVIFGMRGVKRLDKSFYPAYILNYILGGGGFASRFIDKIREKNGLAYSVYSYLSTLPKAGLFVGSVATDNKKVDKSINLIKNEINKIGKNGITEQELQNAKDFLINSFPLKMTKNSKLADFLTVMQIDSLGIDFLEKRDTYVNNVTVDEVNAVSREIMKAKNAIFVVVGEGK